MRNIFFAFIYLLVSTLAFGANTIKDTKLILGINTDVDHVFQIDRAGTDSPYLKWKASTGKWYFSHDGITEAEMGSGSGGGGGGLAFWETGTAYALNDVVIESNKIYICTVAHTSGTFASDIGNWQLVESEAQVVAVTPSGGLASEDVQSALEELQSEIETNATDIATNTSDISTNTSAIAGLDSIYATDAALTSGLAGKQATITGGATSITSADLASDSALVSDGSGKVAVLGTVSTTELGYVNNVTSPIQTQLNAKIPGLSSSNDLEIALFDGATGKLLKAATGTGFVKAAAGAYSVQSNINLATEVGSSVLDVNNGGTSKVLSLNSGGIIYMDANSLEPGAAGTSGQVLLSGGTNAPTWGTLGLTYGGSNKSLTATNGGILWTDTDSHEVTAAGSIGQYLKSNGAASPAWTEAASIVGNLFANPNFEHTLATCSVTSGSSVCSGWTVTQTGTATCVFTKESSGAFPGEGSFGGLTATPGASGGTCSLKQEATTISGVQGLISIMYGAAAGAVTQSATLYTLVNGTRTTSKVITNTSTTAQWMDDFNVPEASTGTTLGIELLINIPNTAVSYFVGLERASVKLGNVSVQSPIITSWQTYSPTLTGFGSGPTSNLEYRQVGSNYEIKGKITAGTTPTGVEARMSLPNAVTSSGTISTIEIAGYAVNNAVSATSARHYNLLIEPSVSYLTFGVERESGTDNPQSKQLGNAIAATGTVIFIDASVPIANLAGSTQVFASQCGASCRDYFTVNVSAADVVAGDDFDFINGDCTNATTGKAVCNFNSGIFTAAPRCFATPTGSNWGIFDVTSISSSAVTIDSASRIDAFTAQNNSFTLTCFKTGADLNISRTIYGSFLNMMTAPGISKPKTCYYKFGGASATLAAPTECTSGTCVEVEDSCGSGSAPAWATVSLYNDLTFAAGTFANSTPVHCTCSAYDVTANTTRDCSLVFQTSDGTWATSSTGGLVTNLITFDQSGTAGTAYVSVTCEGQAP